MKPRTDWTEQELSLGAAIALAMERHPIPPQEGGMSDEEARTTDPMAKAQIKGRPGLQLVVSKTNPRVKRWQRTEEPPKAAPRGRAAPPDPQGSPPGPSGPTRRPGGQGDPARAVVDASTGLARALRRRPAGKGAEVKLDKKQLDLVLNKGKFALISAGASPQDDPPLSPQDVKQRDNLLRKKLIEAGYLFTRAIGKYGEREDSYLVMVHDAQREHMVNLGKELNQDSVIVGDGGEFELAFTTGSKAGKCIHGDSWSRVDDEAADFYTEVPGAGKFSLDLDFSNIGPCKGVLAKATVKAHQRRLPSGKVVQVREHQDGRQSGSGGSGGDDHFIPGESFEARWARGEAQARARGETPPKPTTERRGMRPEAFKAPDTPPQKRAPKRASRRAPPEQGKAPKARSQGYPGWEPTVKRGKLPDSLKNLDNIQNKFKKTPLHQQVANQGFSVHDGVPERDYHKAGQTVSVHTDRETAMRDARIASSRTGDLFEIQKDGSNYAVIHMERTPVPLRVLQRMRERMGKGGASDGIINRAVVRVGAKAGPSEPAQRAGEGDFGSPHAVRAGQTVRFKDPGDKENPETRLGRVEHQGKHGITVVCNTTGRACKIPHGYYTAEIT